MSAPVAFRLASALAAYPDAALAARVERAAAELETGTTSLPAPAAALAAYRGRPAPERESDYIELFDRGVAENPLHEGGYSRHRVLGAADPLADVAGFYRAFGVAPTAGERLDHLAVELEFHAWLLLKEEHLEAEGVSAGVEIVRDARRKFLAEHLAPLALAAAARPGVVASPLYGPLLAWIAGLVRAACAELGVEPSPLALATTRSEPEELRCASAARGPGALPVLSGPG
jgi:nitrate reductase assembly molybdenum cofactor insertion protein NarJ